MDPEPLEACDVFGALTDEEWLAVLQDSVGRPEIQGVEFPRFPDEKIQATWVGSANSDALGEAYRFYKLLKERSADLGVPVTQGSIALDFGCGWGRYLRFFWKDVRVRNLFGVDADPDIIEICKGTGVPGSLQAIQPKGTLPFPGGFFSHVIAYSVFTHLPEPLHLHWLREIARVMKPGGLFVLTLEPRRFLDFVAGLKNTAPASLWHATMATYADSVPEYKNAFDSGKIAYLPTGGGPHIGPDVYGDAAVPLSYVKQTWTPYFEVHDYIDDPARFWQAALIVQRR
jgi:SAM-dependent methyltransferase